MKWVLLTQVPNVICDSDSPTYKYLQHLDIGKHVRGVASKNTGLVSIAT